MNSASSSRRAIVVFVAVLLWLMVVVAFYFIAHKPADDSQLAALMNWVPTLLLEVTLIIVAAGVGRRILAGWGTADQRAAFAVAVGLALFSGVTLVLGMVGWLNPVSGVIALGLCGILGWRGLRSWWADVHQAFDELKPTTAFGRLSQGYCLLVLSIAVLYAVAPPTAWDGLAYHLKGPEVYHAVGRISHSLDLPYLGLPQFGEMLFLYVITLGGQNPSLLQWIFAAMTALLVAGQAQRLWGEKMGWVAAAIYLSAETVAIEAGWPYVDLMLAFHVLAAYICLEAWRSDRRARSLILAGVFAGLAMAVKYTSAPIVIALALIVLLRTVESKVRSVIMFASVAVTVALPWYLKSWLLLGNPFYPFVFNGLYWDPVRSELFNRFGTGLLNTAPLQLLTAPWDASIWGVEGKVGYAATIGPLFLLLVPLALLGWRRFDTDRRTRLTALLLIGVLTYAGWLIGVASSSALRQSRLLIPILPLLAIISAGAFQVLSRWDRPTLSVRRMAAVLVSIVLITTGLKVMLDFGRSSVAPVLTGGVTRDEYLAARLGWYYVAMRALSELAADGAIEFLWEPRSLYCEVDCRPDAMLDHWAYVRRTDGSPDQIAARWQTSGVRYVLVWRSGYQAAQELALNRLSVEDQQALDQLLTQRMTLVRDFGGIYQLYAWQN